MTANPSLLIDKARQCSRSSDLSIYLQNKIQESNGNPHMVINSLSNIYSDEHMKVSLERFGKTQKRQYCISQDSNTAISPISDLTIKVSEFQIVQKEHYRQATLINEQTYKNQDIIILLRGNIYLVEVLNDGIAVVARELQCEYTKETYCIETGLLVSTVASINQHSKLQFAADLLGRFPDKRSLVPLKKLLKHKAHFVRWRAAESFALIASKNEIVEMLRTLTRDPHPHIRSAATTSLASIAE